MFFVSKIACSGIVFLLTTTWISGPHPTPVDSEANLSGEVAADGGLTLSVPEETPGIDVREMQQTLQDKGRYRGKVDGVFGLRTRASIREFQKAETLPVTGQLDASTAAKLGVKRLGVKPEVRQETGYEAAPDKPSAGIKWARGSRRSSRTLQKPATKATLKVPPA
jgi:peptidoglycan hydrolase-like protein with peptidoglycan-binding domain